MLEISISTRADGYPAILHAAPSYLLTHEVLSWNRDYSTVQSIVAPSGKAQAASIPTTGTEEFPSSCRTASGDKLSK